MIRRLFRGRSKPSYERQKEILAQGAAAQQQDLAGDPATQPEVLYYLAQEGDGATRKAVAANPATPIQADEILSADEHEEVRQELARKIARLVPGLGPDEGTRLRERAIAILERLAGDQLPTVRRIVAEEIKSSDKVPRSLAVRLTRDLEAMVAIPVIEYSPLLEDSDLLELIAASQVDGVLEAVARRPRISGEVGDALVATLDIPAITALLANPNAEIREQALNTIIEEAPGIEAWHQPLVLRMELSMRAIQRIAGFVAASLVYELVARHHLDEETMREVAKRVRERVRAQEPTPEDSLRQVVEEAARLALAGRLDEDEIALAIDQGRRDFVLAALSVLSKMPLPAVRQIVGTRAGKPVCALVWKAGLSMRLALKMQRQVAQVPPASLINARLGVDFPMTPQEMSWQLDFFTAEP